MSTGKAIAALSGQDNVLVIRKPFVEWLAGDVVAAMMLDQCLHWSSTDTARKRDGWFYKTDEDWAADFYVSTYQIRKARQALEEEGLIACERRGIPAKMWYACDAEHVAEQFIDWLEGCGRENKSCESERLESRSRETSTANPKDILYTQKITQKPSSEEEEGTAAAAPHWAAGSETYNAIADELLTWMRGDVNPDDLHPATRKMLKSLTRTIVRDHSAAHVKAASEAWFSKHWAGKDKRKPMADRRPRSSRQVVDWIAECARDGTFDWIYDESIKLPF